MTTSLAIAAAAVAWTPAALADPPVAVEAGTLLAVGPRGADLTAGDGAVLLRRPDGAVELRATRDGLPVRGDEGASVEALQRVEGAVDAAAGDREARGALRVAGHVGAGRRFGATGPVRVEGMAERAAIRAGGALTIDGRAAWCELSCGAVWVLRRDLAAALGDAPAELESLVALARQLGLAAAARGASAPPGRVIAALRDARALDLPQRLRRAEACLASARRAWPGLAPGLARALAGARGALEDPGSLQDPQARLAAAAGVLLAATAERPAPDPPAVRLHGPAAAGCDIDAVGDVVARGPGGGLRGGEVRVGRRLVAGELAPLPGRPLVVDLADPRPGRALVSADVVQPGVAVVVAGERIVIDRPRRDLRIGVAAGRVEIHSR